MLHKKYDIIKSTLNVFQGCSDIYLKEDKHWGCDIDIIAEYVEKVKKANVIELGTGYAWHLANLFFKVPDNMGYVVGVDYSENMLYQAQKLLLSIQFNGSSLRKYIDLKNADILNLPYTNEKFDIALVLNNTLGNLPDKNFKLAKNKRERALQEINRIMSKVSYLIVSVYNADKLTEEDKYGEVFELNYEASDIENFDLIINYKNKNDLYYSHWFKKKEISELLYKTGFTILEIEERRKRLVIVSKKTHY